jgi:hypothetical protein
MTARNDQREEGSPGGVLDPRWEDALRAGQESEGGAGSVDAELAVVHLLRHARAPEALGDEALESVWGEIESELEDARPLPWWKRGWVLWGGTVASAAAAAAILVVVWPSAEHETARPDAVAVTTSPAQTLESQFELLAPEARAALGRQVERSRGSLRGDLIDRAKDAGKTEGGAP